eukprot:CAMPEP_0171118780 /NCGR_PEP_ID=MMETSP0766_2-20121228/95539_1 /TAXON_ID=439317 /ORGANISM="Gambierdiscus australes, Strain CAWD 149" /LENGTH=44 /DNA_ID= /DNA_START= /DNA_END= /DNA_ORIENTATION=
MQENWLDARILSQKDVGLAALAAPSSRGSLAWPEAEVQQQWQQQ